MKVESYFFLGQIAFFVPVGIVYGFMTGWTEWVGFLALPLCGVMSGLVGTYLIKHAKVVGPRPEDRDDGEIAEKAGPVGSFAPWSWWPLALGLGAAVCFAGMAIGFWIVFIGASFAFVGVIGWVFEHSRGDYAH